MTDINLPKASPPAANPLEKMGDRLTGNILVVDDTPDNLRLLSNLLTEAGHKVRKVTDGKWALQASLLSPPDLILLDIMMPEMSGYEVCRLLKEMDRTRNVPIIFLSVNDEVLDKVQAFRFGGADYITKPFEPAEVLVRVETQLKIRQLQKRVQEQNLQLQEQNLQLQQEICDRLSAQAALEALNQDLEAKVQSRTTELQKRNQQLLQLHAQLQQVLSQEQHISELKSQLISTLSHEFYAPLSVINFSTELLKRAKFDGNEQDLDRHFQRIFDSVDRIQQTLENALTLAQAESKTIQLNPEPLNLANFCLSLVTNWKLPADKLHQLSFACWGEAPLQVYVDSSLLKQILSQLLKNAIRYAPKGGMIQLDLIYEATSVSFRIQDQGIGIPETDLEKVCDRFYRASNADSIPGIAGAGLGLAVVKRLVEVHGGTLAIASNLGEGTAVTISLPILTEESCLSQNVL